MLMQNLVLVYDELPTESAVARFGSFPQVLAQVFAATGNLEYIRRILSTLKQLLPQATIIGCSTDGTIDNGVIHPYGTTVQITLTGFEHTTLSLAYDENSDDSIASGRSLATALDRPETKTIIAFTEAGSINGELFLEGMHQSGKTQVVIGGVASTPSFTDTFIIADGHILTKGAVAVGLEGRVLHVYQDFLFGWDSILWNIQRDSNRFTRI